MFKPAPQAYGIIRTALTLESTVMIPDLDLYNKLREQLGEDSGDSTYLAIGVGTYRETVRVTNLYMGIVTIERGRDGTIARAFPEGTLVQYHFCSAAVQEMIDNAAGFSVYLEGYGLAQVESTGDNSYSIRVDPPQVTSDNGSISVTSYLNGNVDLAVNANAMGLCNTAVVNEGGF